MRYPPASSGLTSSLWTATPYATSAVFRTMTSDFMKRLLCDWITWGGAERGRERAEGEPVREDRET